MSAAAVAALERPQVATGSRARWCYHAPYLALLLCGTAAGAPYVTLWEAGG